MYARVERFQSKELSEKAGEPLELSEKAGRPVCARIPFTLKGAESVYYTLVYYM